MYQKILVPLDGSTLSELALPHAEALARHFDSEIILTRVCQPVAMPVEFYPAMAGVAYDYQLDLQTQVEKEVKEYIINWQKRLQLAKLKCRYLVLEGFVPEAILKVAETEAVDLIVMSTHGRSGLSRWVYGSVAAKVLQAAPCPIFLVRAKSHPGDD
ncbi:MAG: universal stress protein [Anaerolineales bacterium]|nr:universal stress protein [Anaerolineales bacterium]